MGDSSQPRTSPTASMPTTQPFFRPPPERKHEPQYQEVLQYYGKRKKSMQMEALQEALGQHREGARRPHQGGAGPPETVGESQGQLASSSNGTLPPIRCTYSSN